MAPKSLLFLNHLFTESRGSGLFLNWQPVRNKGEIVFARSAGILTLPCNVQQLAAQGEAVQLSHIFWEGRVNQTAMRTDTA